MKYVIASDIHGDKIYAEKIVEIFKKEKAKKLILLGDIYNHGPRNKIPVGYSPMGVAEVLNAVKDKLIVVKGNCDSVVDAMISDFDFIEDMCLSVHDKTVFLTHGHVYNVDNPPKTKFDAVLYGHLHTGFVKEKDGTFFINAGSLSLPKQGTANSYLILDDQTVYLKSIDGKVIEKVVL